MITLFKIFENITPPKYKKGDIVYNKATNGEPKKCIIIKVISQTKRPDNDCTRYILDRYPNLTVREDALIPEHEFDAKKYNL